MNFMRQFFFVLFLLSFIVPQKLAAQDMVFSDFNAEDHKDINFEILGKMNDTYVVYKNIRWKHMIAVYDNNMQMKKSSRLKFVPDKTFNIDFITYPDYFYIIYQYQKNGIIYCMGAKLDATGEKLNGPVQLDTTRVGILADNKIYNTIYSQDKQKIMISKMPRKNEKMTIATKLFDVDMNLLDSSRYVTPIDLKRDIYGDMLLDNEGNFIYTKETQGIFKNKASTLQIISYKPKSKEPKILTIDLKDKYIDQSLLTIDNLNKRYIFNSFYSNDDPGNIKGLFTTLVDAVTVDTIKTVFNDFPDSVRAKANTDGLFKSAFDNFVMNQAVVKKDGGFILATEDQAMQTRGNPNTFGNRNYYNYYNSPGLAGSDYYYLNNPGYNYYRPYSSYSNWQDVRFFYDNVLILSLDKNLNLQWNTVILKTQSDDEADNFLSFSTMNVGGEIRFLYNEGARRQILGSQSIQPNGDLKRYPTLKSGEAGYEFMPKLAKQVGYKEMIIPCIYRSSIAFAKVIFTD